MSERTAPRLAGLFTRYGSDKDTDHSYGPFYEELLAPRRDRIAALLEVGIAGGGSLRAWRAYLPPTAVVVGMDHHADPGPIPGVGQVRADSTNATAVEAALGTQTFDAVVDDGCHWADEQLATFANLWSRVRAGGVYVIEDVQAVWDTAGRFEAVGGTVVDRRGVKGRQDDVLVVFYKP